MAASVLAPRGRRGGRGGTRRRGRRRRARGRPDPRADRGCAGASALRAQAEAEAAPRVEAARRPQAARLPPAPRRARRAVAAVQRVLRIAADGAFGPGTKRALRRAPGGAVQGREPLRWGAVGPDSFDCSGLVMWSAERAGMTVPRTSFLQYRTGSAVARNAIRAGDLVAFDTGGPGPSHVGIAVDAATAASTPSHGVRQHEIFDSYWGSHWRASGCRACQLWADATQTGPGAGVHRPRPGRPRHRPPLLDPPQS